MAFIANNVTARHKIHQCWEKSHDEEKTRKDGQTK